MQTSGKLRSALSIIAVDCLNNNLVKDSQNTTRNEDNLVGGIRA